MTALLLRSVTRNNLTVDDLVSDVNEALAEVTTDIVARNEGGTLVLASDTVDFELGAGTVSADLMGLATVPGQSYRPGSEWEVLAEDELSPAAVLPDNVVLNVWMANENPNESSMWATTVEEFSSVQPVISLPLPTLREGGWGEEIAKWIDAILFNVKADGVYQDVAGLCKVATLDEIEAQDWSLNPGRYVGVPEREEDADFDFEVRLTELHEELETLNSEAHELEARIAQKVVQILSNR